MLQKESEALSLLGVRQEELNPQEDIYKTEIESEEPSIGEITQAAFARYNTVGSAARYVFGDGNRDREVSNPSYDPVKKAVELGRTDVLDQVIFADNDEEFDKILKDVDTLREYDRILRDGGGFGTAMSLVAGVVDPTILIPMGGAFNTLKSGYRAAAVIGSWSVGGAVAASTYEGVLVGTQQDREAEDVLDAAVFGAVLGGALGTAFKGLPAAAKSDIAHNFAEALGMRLYKNRKMNFNEDGTVKEATEESFKAQGKSGKAAESVLRTTGSSSLAGQYIASAVNRFINSKSNSVKRFSSMIYDHGFILEGNTKNKVPVDQSVEFLNKKKDVELINIHQKTKREFKDMLDNNDVSLNMKVFGKERPSFTDFSEEVATAMRAGGNHEIKQVASTASILLKEADNVLKEMVEVGIFSDDILKSEGRQRYLTRRWNTLNITIRETEFRQMLAEDFARGTITNNSDQLIREALEKRVKELEKYRQENGELVGRSIDDYERFGIIRRVGKNGEEKFYLKDEIIDTIRRTERLRVESMQTPEITEEVLKQVDETVRTLKGTDFKSDLIDNELLNSLSGQAQEKTSFTKRRLLNLNEERYKDFIENDGIELSLGYLNKAKAMVNVNRVMQKNGFKNVADFKRSVEEEYRELIAKESDEEARKSLARGMKKDLDDIDRSIKSMVGYRENREFVNNQVWNTVKNMNVASLLGGVVISSLTEPFMRIFRNGFFKSASRTIDEVIHKDLAKMSKDQLNKHIIINEILVGDTLTRLMSGDSLSFGTAESLDKTSKAAKLQRGSAFFSESLAYASGMKYFNHVFRRSAGYQAQIEVIDLIKKGKGRTQAENEKLRSLRIAEEDEQKILDAVSKHGDTRGNAVFPNFEMWESSELRDKFLQAVRTETDSTMLSANKADQPLWSTESTGASLLFQFKSFLMAANNKILVSGLQRSDINVLSGLVTLITVGGIIDIMKKSMYGYDFNKHNYDVGSFITGGIQRSGVLGILGEMSFNFAGKSKYGHGDLYNFILGPGANFITTAYGLKDIVKGDMEQIDKIRSLLPYQNLFYLKMLERAVFDSGSGSKALVEELE